MGVRLLRGFARVWGALVVVFILVNIAFIWYFEGFAKVQEIMGPYNVLNFVVTVVLLSPAIGAWSWAERLERKAKEKRAANAGTAT